MDRQFVTGDGRINGEDIGKVNDGGETNDDIKALENIASKVKDGGNLIINACSFGGCPATDEISNSFVQSIHKFTGARLNVYTPTGGFADLYATFHRNNTDGSITQLPQLGYTLPPNLSSDKNTRWIGYNGSNFMQYKDIIISQEAAKPVEFKK